MAKILVVEDDPMAAEAVKSKLAEDGHLVELAVNGEDALQLLGNFEFDLIILDWSLPGLSGVQVCKEYRKRGGTSWIIFCTSMSQIDDKEAGLEAGADDYIVKPFNMRELSARVKRALRRSGSPFQTEFRIGDVLLDSEKRQVLINNEAVKLMPKEYALLEYLMKNADQKIPPKKLLAAVWPSDSEVSEGTVRTFILSLRQKLEKAGKKGFIKTVTGFGYVIETGEVESSQS